MLLPMENVEPCTGNLLDVVLTNHCPSSNLLDIVYGLVQLKYVILIFTIHNMFDWIYTKSRTKIYEMLSTTTTCSL